MSNINIQRVHDASVKQSRPLSQETIDLLNRVQARAFELSQRRGGVPGHEIEDWLQAEKEVFRVPDTELAENEGEFQLQLAVPGFDPDDIRVAAFPDAVVVEGKAAHKHRGMDGTVHFCEFGERRLFRRIPLPKPVDVDHVSATLDKGMLRLRAEKAEPPKAKRVVA